MKHPFLLFAVSSREGGLLHILHLSVTCFSFDWLFLLRSFSYSLKCADELIEIKATINVLVISHNPRLQVGVREIRRAAKIAEEYAQVVTCHLSMGILVNSLEDGKNAVVMLGQKSVLYGFSLLKRFNFPYKLADCSLTFRALS